MIVRAVLLWCRFKSDLDIYWDIIRLKLDAICHSFIRGK